MKMKLTHIRLLVTDYGACFRFYRDVMKFKLEWGEEDGVYADFKISGIALSLFDRALMATALDTQTKPLVTEMQDPFALIFEVKNVDKAFETIMALGVKFVTIPHDQPNWGIRVAHLRDPDGNLIELNEPLDD